MSDLVRDPGTSVHEPPTTIPWSHTTRTFAALGHTFRIRTTDTRLGAYLDDVLAGLSAPESVSPETTYSFVTTDSEPWPYALWVNGERIGSSGSGAYILDYLFWHVNRHAIERTPNLLLLHAAGVERDGVCVVLPAAMENGKTTLTAGLMRSGFRYYTDEAVAIDPQDLKVTPYAKPLSIDPGSWGVLADLEPDIDESVRPLVVKQWQVPVTSIAASGLAEPLIPRLIINPQYRAGAVTELRPVRRAEMLVMLMDLTFSFREDPARNMAVLGEVLARCDCYHLVVGDLETACALVSDIVARLSGSTTRSSV